MEVLNLLVENTDSKTTFVTVNPTDIKFNLLLSKNSKTTFVTVNQIFFNII